MANSKAEGRKLCLQRQGTAGQDYRLTFRGALGRGSERLWQPLLREGTGCQPEASARSWSWLSPRLQSAASRSLRRARLLVKQQEFMQRSVVRPWDLPQRDGPCPARMLCAASLSLQFSPHLITWEENAAGVGLSFRDTHFLHNLMQNLAAQFRCWCWNVLCVGSCPLGQSHLLQGCTKLSCFLCLLAAKVFSQLMVRNRNTWETGSVVAGW